MIQKIVIVIAITMYVVGFGNLLNAQQVKRLVFENMSNDIQDKQENGKWSEWRSDLWNYTLSNTFTILDFENKSLITSVFTANDNSVNSDTMQMIDLVIDNSKFPFLTAKFKASHSVSNIKFYHSYEYIGYAQQGDYDYFLYDEVSYLSNNKMIIKRNKTYLRWKINE